MTVPTRRTIASRFGRSDDVVPAADLLVQTFARDL